MLAVGAELYSLSSFGEPLLLEAVHSGHLDLIQHLFQEGYKVDHAIGDSCTTGVMIPLHVAISNGRLDIVAELLAAGACTEYHDVDKDTALIAAANCDQGDMVEILIKHKCIINAAGFEGNTAMHRAVEQGHNRIVDILLESGLCDINLTNDQGNTAFFVACSSGNVAAAKAIATRKDLNVSHVNKLGKNAYLMASVSGKADFIPLLLSLGVDCNLQDQFGNTALIISAFLEFQGFAVDLLEQSDIRPELKGKNGRTALHWAAWQGLGNLTDMLLKGNRLLGNGMDKNGDTPFILAAKNKQFHLLDKFGHADCDVNIQGDRGKTALHWVSNHGDPDGMKAMLSIPDLDINKQDSLLNTALLYTAINHHYTEMKLLLPSKPDVNIVGEGGRTALHWVCQRDYTDMVRQLLNHGAKTDIADSAGDYPLLLAASKGHGLAVKELLEAGANVNVIDSRQRTALHHCSLQGMDISVSLLIQHGASLNIQDTEQDTALLLAAKAGHEEIISLLVKARCDVNIPGKENRLALFYTAQKGMSKSVGMLLKHKAKMDNDCYSSPLIQASKHGHLEVVSMLLANGAKVDFKDRHGRTALIWAGQGGHVDIIRLLLKHGADPKLQDLSGKKSFTGKIHTLFYYSQIFQLQNP